MFVEFKKTKHEKNHFFLWFFFQSFYICNEQMKISTMVNTFLSYNLLLNVVDVVTLVVVEGLLCVHRR